MTRAPIALDFAVLLAESKPLYEALHPETKRGGDRKSGTYRAKIKAKRISFCSVWAAKLGLTERSVEMTVAIGNAFNHSEVQSLRGSCIADNAAALRDLAAREAAARATLIALLAAGTRSYKAALIACRLRFEIAHQERLFHAFVDLWANADQRTCKRILVHAGLTPEDARVIAALTDQRARRAKAKAAAAKPAQAE